MKIWNQIVIFQITKKEKKDLFYICAISSGVNFIPVDNHEHVSYLYFFCKGQVST